MCDAVIVQTEREVMARTFVRTWIEADPEEIAKELLVVGESFSTCGNCKHLGLDFSTAKVCPECHVNFTWVSSLRAASGSHERFHWIKRIRDVRPELRFVDYDDLKRGQDLKRARDLLS